MASQVSQSFLGASGQPEGADAPQSPPVLIAQAPPVPHLVLPPERDTLRLIFRAPVVSRPHPVLGVMLHLQDWPLKQVPSVGGSKGRWGRELGSGGPCVSYGGQ